MKDKCIFEIMVMRGKGLENMFPQLDKDGVELLKGMLRMSPK